MVGFVYEADQKAIKDAQDRLDDLRHNEILKKFDDAIEAIEKLKETDNIYDYSGQNVIKDLDMITGADALYELVRGTVDIDRILSDSIMNNAGTAGAGAGSTAGGSAPVIQIGDIYLSGVQDTNTLADAIVRELPNLVLQKMYQN